MYWVTLFMKITNILLVIFLIISFSSLISCQQVTSASTVTISVTETKSVPVTIIPGVTSTATIATTAIMTTTVIPNMPSAPVPVYTNPGTGGVVGKILFPDQLPALGAAAYIFKSGETTSYATGVVDSIGYYVFNNIPAGTYEIFTSTAIGPFFTGAPQATITVTANSITVVNTLTTLRTVTIQLDNPRTASIPGKPYTSYLVINGANSKFSWSNLTNAAYYTVRIWALTSNPLNPPIASYDESQTVTVNSIIWPFDLGSLSSNTFQIIVSAYMANNTLLSYGYSLNFAVNTPPPGWAFN